MIELLAIDETVARRVVVVIISGIAERAKKIGKINLPLHSVKQAVEQGFISLAKRLQPEFFSHSLVEVSQVGRLVIGQ